VSDATSGRSVPLSSARRVTALLVLLLSGFYAAHTWQTLSIGRWHKPGAAIFPLALAALLAISALSVLLERRSDDRFTLPAGADLRRLLLLLAAFALYFLVMPVIGNMPASALFLIAAMWLLSDDPARSLLRIAIYAVAIAIAFEWFFVRLLQVQMPGGLFRQWLF
jgi:NADH:ubiquinone oxidoreductase subunit 6 (subunit J)